MPSPLICLFIPGRCDALGVSPVTTSQLPLLLHFGSLHFGFEDFLWREQGGWTHKGNWSGALWRSVPTAVSLNGKMGATLPLPRPASQAELCRAREKDRETGRQREKSKESFSFLPECYQNPSFCQLPRRLDEVNEARELQHMIHWSRNSNPIQSP